MYTTLSKIVPKTSKNISRKIQVKKPHTSLPFHLQLLQGQMEQAARRGQAPSNTLLENTPSTQALLSAPFPEPIWDPRVSNYVRSAELWWTTLINAELLCFDEVNEKLCLCPKWTINHQGIWPLTLVLSNILCNGQTQSIWWIYVAEVLRPPVISALKPS